MLAIAGSLAALPVTLILPTLARKARYALVGELDANASSSDLLPEITRLVGLFVCPGTVGYLPAWLRSLASRQSPLDSQVPWIPYPALRYLEEHLNSGSHVFEYGGGGSTLWLAQRVGHLTTVEHHATWHSVIHKALEDRHASNVTLLLREPDLAGTSETAPNGFPYLSARISGSFEGYVRAIDEVPDGSLDLVIVDGRSRMAALKHAISKLRVGGLLMLDDSYRRRYEEAYRILGSWHRDEFCGIRPYSLSPSRTTFWLRPAGVA